MSTTTIPRFDYFIPMNTASSKNGKICFGMAAVDSPNVKRYKHRTARFFQNQRADFRATLLMLELELPYCIELTFIRDSRQRFDYINMAQVIADQMTDYGWVIDDNADNVKFYFGDYEYDKEKPGCRIKLLLNKPKHY